MRKNSNRQLLTRVALSLAVFVAVFSCVREYPPEDGSKILSGGAQELQKAFVREYREHSLRSEAMQDSIFGFEGLKPQWQWARSETTESGIRFIEVPLNADLAALPVSSSLHEHLDACEGKTVNLTYLIRKEHPTDSTRTLNYFISIMPSFQMIASDLSLDHRPGAVPAGFDGEVLFFNLSGTLRHKYVYENGSLTERYKAVYQPQTRTMMVVEDCHLVRWEKDWYECFEDANGNESNHRYTHTQYWYEVECTPRIVYIADSSYDEYNGDGGGGGDGNTDNQNDDPESEKLKDPCENMKTKLENTPFMTELDNLKGLASGSIEYGRAFTYDGTNFSFTTHNGYANGINYTPSSSHPIDGFIHTHNVDNGHSHIFTGDDLFSIYDLYRKGGINNIDTFTFGLVTKNGCYFLKVTDVNAFTKFFSDENYDTEIYNDLLFRIYKNQGTQQDAVDGFVKFLDTSNTGIVLLERSGKGFHQKRIMNNEVKNITC